MQVTRTLAGFGLAFAAASCGTEAAGARDAGAEARSTAVRSAASAPSSTDVPSAPPERRAETPPSASSVPSATGAARSCAAIGADIARVEAKHAAAAGFPCATAADCACYGGPVCPNALVKQCPAPIGKGAERELAPLSAEWSAAQCAGYLWSPYECEAACIAGRCGSSR